MNELIEAHLDYLRRKRGRADTTIEGRRKVLCRMDRELPAGLTAATANELEAWLYREEWGPQTRANYINHTIMFFRWACDPLDPQLDFNPAVRLVRPPLMLGMPRPATQAELQHALNRLPDPWRLCVKFAAYAGLRCCEIALQDRDDITEQTISIPRGKGGKAAILPTHPVIWEDVKDRPGGLLVRRKFEAGPVSRKYLSGRIAVALDRIRLPHLAAHSFRHFYGTELYAATKDLRVTQELMRHASPKTTAIYTLISGEERRIAIAALPTFARPAA